MLHLRPAVRSTPCNSQVMQLRFGGTALFMDTRRLHAFVKIVDIGSLTRAAAILHIAQPALSQQIVALETHFGKQLLVRSKRGVIPTDAGRALYRHAQVMLRQLEQAETDIESAGTRIAGHVSVGLAHAPWRCRRTSWSASPKLARSSTSTRPRCNGNVVVNH